MNYKLLMQRFLILWSLLISIAFSGTAQTFTAAVSRNKIGVGEQLRITFTLNGSGSDFKAPAFNDFQILGGPNQSNSMQIVNGSVSQSISYSFILSPKKEGKITIGPASINSGGKKLESQSLTIEVVKGNPGNQQGNQPGAAQGGQRNQQGSSIHNSDNQLFLKAFVSKNKVYLGEEVIVTFRIYTRVNIVQNSLDKVPSFNGFWTQEIDLPDNIQLNQEMLDGVPYNVATIKKTLLFPQKEGNLVIDPIGMECIVRRKTQGRGNSIFDQFFGGVEDVKYKLESTPIKIQVLGLPEHGKPANFKGAVGEFYLKSEIDKEKLKANDAATIKLRVSGKGNLKLIEAPTFEFPTDFEIFDPKISDHVKVSEGGMQGNMDFEYLVIPRNEGNFKIPESAFSFFNPETRSYVDLKIPEFNLEVEKDSRAAGSPGLFNSQSKEDIKILGEDIRFIKETSELSSIAFPFFGSISFYIFLTAPFILLGLFLILRRRHLDIRKDPLRYKSSIASSIAAKRLKKSKIFLAEKKDKEFFLEISRAVYGYLSDKFSIPPGNISMETIINRLKEEDFDKTTLELFTNSINTCELARYSPVSGQDAEKVYLDSVQLIMNLEEKKKKNTRPVVLNFLGMMVLLVFMSGIGKLKADPNSDSFKMGNALYKEKKYTKAIALYDSLVKTKEIRSPELFYNLGNAYFKSGDFAMAILNYERALKLNPDDPDLNYNLIMANQMIKDKMEARGRFIIGSWFNKFLSSKSPDSWGWNCIIALTMGCFLLVIYISGKSWVYKRVGFFLAILFFLYGSFSFIMGKLNYRKIYESKEAIIIIPSVNITSAPTEGANKLFVIHSGLKVNIIEKNNDWVRIQLSNGSEGWIKSSGLEVI